MAVVENVGIFVREKVWLKPNLFPYKYPNIFNPIHSSHLPAYEYGTDRVFQNVGIYIKFRRWGITQKKAYSIQNTARV
jgi:hypothetical protein